METEDEKTMALEAEMRACKQLLAQTDYKALKHADGALTDEEYAETGAQRQGWRDRINEIEAELAADA